MQLAYLVNFAEFLPVIFSTFYFSALQISLTLFGITFSWNIYILFFLFPHKSLAVRILGGLENNWSTDCIFNRLFLIFSTGNTTRMSLLVQQKGKLNLPHEARLCNSASEKQFAHT